MNKNKSSITSYSFIEQSFLDNSELFPLNKRKSERRTKRKNMFLVRVNFFKKISRFGGFNSSYTSSPVKALPELSNKDYGAIVSWSKHQKSCGCYMCSKAKAKIKGKGFNTRKRLVSCDFQLSIADEPACYVSDLEFCENYL